MILSAEMMLSEGYSAFVVVPPFFLLALSVVVYPISAASLFSDPSEQATQAFFLAAEFGRFSAEFLVSCELD